MDFQKKLLKCLCFSTSTLVTRFISFLGLVMGLTLITVLLSDKFGDNYDNSRLIALALGLDWQHLHFHANTSHEADPEGKLITAIVITYAFLHIAINLILLYATIMSTRCCAYLWLFVELISCISKVGALIYHLTTESGQLKKIFFIGSAIYIIITLWCCGVVYVAQTTWKYERKDIYQYEFWNSQSDNFNADDEISNNNTPIPSTPPLANIGYDIV